MARAFFRFAKSGKSDDKESKNGDATAVPAKLSPSEQSETDVNQSPVTHRNKSKKKVTMSNPQELIQKGRQMLANQQIDEAVEQFKIALEYSSTNRCLMDCISSGYHLGSSYVMQLKSADAITILVETIHRHKDLSLIQAQAGKNDDGNKILADMKIKWKDTNFILDNDEYANQIKGYKLYYHMAKAFEISTQLKFAADYYKQTLQSLASNAKTNGKNTQFNIAVEKVTLERIRGDASLRLAICLLKLNTDDPLSTDFLYTSFEHLTVAIDVYRLLKRDMDLAYTLIWLLRANHLATVMEMTELGKKYDIDNIVREAEVCLTRCDTTIPSTWKHTEKLKTELGYVTAQMSLDRAETLLSTSITTFNGQLAGPDTQSRPPSDREWMYIQKARAEHGLSEYHHNKGNKKGAFKVLIDASKDYARAGNEVQRCKCLVLAVDNGVKFMLTNAKRRAKHARVLLDILNAVIQVHDELQRNGSDGVLSRTARDAYMLKADIHEICREYDEAEAACKAGYQIFESEEDHERLAELIHRKTVSRASHNGILPLEMITDHAANVKAVFEREAHARAVEEDREKARLAREKLVVRRVRSYKDFLAMLE